MYFIYEDICPECTMEPKGKVVRQIFSRYGYCSKNCGVLLLIPSWREPEQKVSTVCWQVGDGNLQRMTREHYEFLSVLMGIASARIGEKYPRLVDVIHAMR